MSENRFCARITAEMRSIRLMPAARYSRERRTDLISGHMRISKVSPER